MAYNAVMRGIWPLEKHGTIGKIVPLTGKTDGSTGFGDNPRSQIGESAHENAAPFREVLPRHFQWSGPNMESFGERVRLARRIWRFAKHIFPLSQQARSLVGACLLQGP